MKKSFWAMIRKSRNLLVVLAGVVVFVVTYALILPAITIDKDAAVDEPGMEIVMQDDETSEAESVSDVSAENESNITEEGQEDASEAPAEGETEEEPSVSEAPQADEAEESTAEAEESTAEAEESTAEAEESTAEAEESTAEAGTPAEGESETAAEGESETAAEGESTSEEITEETSPEAESLTGETETESRSENASVPDAEPSETQAPAPEELQSSDGSTASDESPAVELPPIVLKEKSGGVTVMVEAEEGVFPADTVLTFDLIEPDSLIPVLVNTLEADVVKAECIDISFTNSEGEPVTPQDSYHVAINTNVLKNKEDNAVIVLDGTDARLIEDATFSYKSTSFETNNASSTIAVVHTKELTAEYLSANGALYEVTVTYNAAAGVPDDSRLRITEYSHGSAKYNATKEAVLGSEAFLSEAPAPAEATDGGILLVDGIPVDENGEDAMGMDAFDLTIYGPNGAPVEPAAPVQVSVRRKALPAAGAEAEDYGDVSVMHLNESGDAPFVENMQPQVLITEDGISATFETESFSTYTLNWTYRSNNRTYYRSSTIHYGYMNGNNFVEFPNGTITQDISISTSASPAFLIYDAPGYEFSSAHLNSPTGTEIEPLIRYNSSRWQYAPDGTTDWANIAYSNNTTANQDIYMVYHAKQPVMEGGEAKLYEYGADDTPPVPTAEKNSVNNHDGTRTISLSISGGATPIEVEKLADVIVVFDVSGSMGRYINSESDAENYEDSRLYHTKEAAKALADELLNGAQYFNRDGEHLVRMSLIKFSNIAEQVNGGFEFGNFTEDYATFAAAIDGMNAAGGTNWEHSLQLANEVSDLDPDRATFVIFITDGNPTWRMTRSPQDAMTDTELLRTGSTVRDMLNSNTYQYYRQYNVFGRGDSDNLGNNYAAALAQVESIISHNKLFYSIGVSNAVTNLEQLTTEAHANVGKDGTDHSFSVSDEDELYDAFDEIRAAIAATLGWTNVDIDDGITEETELSAKVPVADLAGTADFEYYVTKNGVTTPWTLPSNCQPAAYNQASGCVEWHMGSNFQLEQGVTYTVKFKVWPSQQALDYITQIQNGVITYDELPDNVKEQIVLDPATGVYTLKTNKDPMTFSYELSKKTGDTVVVDHSLSGEGQITVINSDPLVLDSMIMRIDKEWLDFLNNAEDRMDEVTLYLQRRLHDDANGPDDGWEDFEVFHRNADGLWETTNRFVFNETNEWSISFYITPGLIDAANDSLDPGYEYRVEEPEIDYHYVLDAEIIRPMFYGHETVTEGNKENLEQKDVYIVENYLGDSDGSHSLSAVNKLKGSLDVRKILYENGSVTTNDDTEFTIKGYILDPEGNPYTFDTSIDTRTDVSGRTGASQEWLEHQNDPIAFHVYDSTGKRVGYKMHVPTTGDITLHLKAGEYVRFVNIPRDCTYAFWEVTSDLPQGYQWVSVEGYNQYRENGGDLVPYESHPYAEASGTTDDGDYWVGGTIYEDAHHNVDVTNRMLQPNHISVTKKVTKADGETQIWPDDGFTFHGGIWNWRGTPYTFDPAWDDRTDRSQGIPEAEYDNYTWDDHQDDPIAYNILDKDGNYVVYKGHFDSTDEISFTLKSGETIEFLDVPTASTYRFWEDTDGMDAPDSIYRFVSAEGSAMTAGGNAQQQPYVWEDGDGNTVVSGTMYEGEDHAVTVTNKMSRDPVPVRLMKIDADENDVKLNGAAFLLYADASHETPATDYRGNPIGEIVTGGFADEEQTEPLGIAQLGDLWPGTYYLTETSPPPGHDPLTEDVVITVSETGSVSVTIPESAGATGSGVLTDPDGTVVIPVPNPKVNGVLLPSTGGPGTFLYISGGIAMITAAVLIYIFGLLRRKGGKRKPEFP